MNRTGAIQFFNDAQKYVIDKGFFKEIDYCRSLQFDKCTPKHFLMEYAYVVISSGMKNQVADKIFERFMNGGGLNVFAIGHRGKREAIERAIKEHQEWFTKLQVASDKLAFLDTLPWIGPITKYHLARNVGLDVVKPDRHLVRLAAFFEYPDAATMCAAISESVHERVGVVDVILWRYSNLTGTRDLGDHS